MNRKGMLCFFIVSIFFSSKITGNSNKSRIFAPEKLFALSKNVRFLLSALSNNKDNLLFLKSRNGSSFIWIHYLTTPIDYYALATNPVKIGTARECFVVNQLGYSHTVEYGKAQGDFKIEGKWTFEVGGEGKSFNQIADFPNSFVLSDDIEMPRGNKLPLWMMGLLY